LVFIVKKIHEDDDGDNGKHLGEFCKCLDQLPKLENFQFRMQNALNVDLAVLNSIYSSLQKSNVKIFWLDTNANIDLESYESNECIQLLALLSRKMKGIEAFSIVFRAVELPQSTEIKDELARPFKEALQKQQCPNLELDVYRLMDGFRNQSWKRTWPNNDPGKLQSWKCELLHKKYIYSLKTPFVDLNLNYKFGWIYHKRASKSIESFE